MVRWLLVGWLLLGCGFYLAAEAIIRPELTIGQESGPSGSNPESRLVYVDYAIPAGMHQFRQDQFFKLELVGTDSGFRAGATQYPPTTEVITGIPAWSGTVRLKLPVTGNSGDVLRVRAGWQICYDTGVCLRPETQYLTISVTKSESLAESDGALLWYLALAFLGGLILNLMPCVLPVLALKALGLVRHAEGDYGTRVQHGLATSAGVMVSMLTLAGLIVALQAGGRLAGWGFQFQSPWYTMGLGLIVLSFALSLWGVWSINAPVVRSRAGFDPGKSHAKSGLAGNFLNGVLTVVLATPCTAPFLGTALGFAFAAQPGIIFLILAAAGAGLALPMLLLSLIPGALKFLPKPGQWMDRLSQLMGFALLATFVWLVSIVLRQISLDAFMAFLWFAFFWVLLLLTFGWVQRSGFARPWRILIIIGLLGLALSGGFLLVRTMVLPASNLPKMGAFPTSGVPVLPEPWQIFDEAAIGRDLDQGHPVLVDFTAEWCLTCKLNEAGPLADAGVLQSFHQAGAVLYRGDYTNGNLTIDTWLARYKRAGVPFYLWLRPDGSHQILPELLTVAGLQSLAAGSAAPRSKP